MRKKIKKFAGLTGFKIENPDDQSGLSHTQ